MRAVHKDQVQIFSIGNHWVGHVSMEMIWSRKFDYLYGACSKNGCSSIKRNLALLENPSHAVDDNPHYLELTGLQNLLDATPLRAEKLLVSPRTFRFNFCRNPYSRLLSAFENRVNTYGFQSYESGGTPKEFIRNRTAVLAHRSGLHPSSVDPSDPISLEDFVHYVCEQDYHDMDRHWYPQTRSMHVDVINYDFTGRLENFDRDWLIVIDHIRGGADTTRSVRLNANPPATTDPERISVELRKMIASKFEEDFDCFGYDTGFADVHAVSKPDATAGMSNETSDVRAVRLNIVIDARKNVFKLRETISSLKRLDGQPFRTIAIVARDRSRFSDYITAQCNALVETGTKSGTGFLAKVGNELSADCDFVMVLSAGERIASPDALYSALAIFGDRPETNAVAGLNLELHYRGEEIGWNKLNRYRWRNTAGFFMSDPGGRHDVVAPTHAVPAPKYGSDRWYQICELFSGPFIGRKEAFADFVEHSRHFTAIPSLALHVAKGWAERKRGTVVFYPFFLLTEKVYVKRKANGLDWNGPDVGRYLELNGKQSIDIFGTGTWRQDENANLSFIPFYYRNVNYAATDNKDENGLAEMAFNPDISSLERDLWSYWKPATRQPTKVAKRQEAARRKFETLKETLVGFKLRYGVSISENDVEILSSRRLLRRALRHFVKKPFKQARKGNGDEGR